MYITDSKTSEDWRNLKLELEESEGELLWHKAYSDFFWGRVNSRYFDPIDQLKKTDVYRGYGFIIMTTLCSLIEFIESTYRGEIYRQCNDNQLNPNEYNKSKSCFNNFLISKSPFKYKFNDAKAKEFYASIRCGLLHEASTKNGWKIWGKSDSGKEIICFESKIVFRDDFEDAIKEYIDLYRKELVRSKELQQAFIRKFDSLCE